MRTGLTPEPVAIPDYSGKRFPAPSYMATAEAYKHPRKSFAPGQARIEVSVEQLSLTAVTHRTLCQTFVEKLLEQEVVDYAALWVRTGLMHQAPVGGYELAKELPEKTGTRHIRPDDELALWAEAAGPFGWRISDSTVADQPSAHPGLMLAFAQGTEIILLLHISAEGTEIATIQSSLTELSEHLHTAARYSASPRSSGPVQVDLGFLEAMAMGDDAFVIHMLGLCVEQLVEGSQKLAEAAAANSVVEVGEVSHKLRSTARTAGAERLDELLATVEMLARGGCVGAVNPAVHGCEQAITGINKILMSKGVD